MSHPPAGWYPDPTGQPNTIRFWNGEKWTNQTEIEQEDTADQPDPVRQEAVVGETAGPGLRSVQQSAHEPAREPVHESVQESVQESRDGETGPGGWWQPTATPQLWDLEPTDDGTRANGGPRLRAVTPEEPAQDAGPSAAERAQATWGAPEIAPAPPEHWTQREVTEEELEAERGAADVPAEAVEAAEPSSWTLKLAPTPSEPVEATEGWSDVSFTEQPRFAPTPKEDVQPEGDVSEQDPEVQAADAAEVAAQLQPDWGSQADEQQEQQSSDQPSWGVEASDEEDLQTPDHPAAPLWTMPDAEDATQEQPVPVQLWGDQPTQQQPEESQPWDAAQTQPDQSWGGEQAWGPQQGAAGNEAPPADNGWGVGDQHAVQESGPWSPQADEQQWGGQGWPVQQAGDQQNGNQQAGNGWAPEPSWVQNQQNPAPVQQNGAQPWSNDQGDQQPWDNGQGEQQPWGNGQGEPWAGQQNAAQQNRGQQSGGQQSGPPQGGVQQAWGEQQHGGQAGGVQQAWGEQQTQRAWGEDENEAWGGQTDLSSGVGTKKSKGSGGGGGGRSGAKLPLFVGGGIALVLLIVLAVVLITGGGDDKQADPTPTGTPTQSSGTPTNQSTTKPGQSKNPKLHEGTGRISSDAISFPRQNPPWSDRKRLVQQLLNSSGQHIVLQENVNGADDWTADIFVGGLGTGSGFNGDAKATAATLSGQLRTSMYGSIPATYRTVANGAVKRTDKSGWFYQQTVTAKSAAVTDRVLTLTVAVFDLGDGTAVAYISGIPNNRPDLKAAESQAYKGINVG
ncbi:DUF2510 domain-containing protein [Kribbella sp. NPDC000426]|uniref:DUF2510 domain-containing protein n=1 Tax=Kribbella sp. NPDC000426 TaxID=3154255 RepID=UPI00331BCE04